MPVIHVDIMEGRTEVQVAELIEKLTKTTEETLNVPRENIRVLVREVPKTHWGIGGKTAKSLGR